VSNGGGTNRWLGLFIALVVINTSLTFVNVWPTLSIRPTLALSPEVAITVLGLAVFGSALVGSRRIVVLRWLSILWVILVLGRYVDVTTRSLYGREINLYWDTRNIPDVGAMLAFVANPWVLIGVVVTVLAVPLLIYFPARWAFGRVLAATQHPPVRQGLITIGVATLLLGIAQRIDERVPSTIAVPEPSSAAYVRQAWKVASEIQRGGERFLPAGPEVHSDLSRVAGADVLLLFIESYGAVSWERPEFSRALAPGRADFTSTIADTGRRVVTAYVQSPTFGGKSWLAHISLLSGIDVLDEDTNAALMAEKRQTLVAEFGSRGYRTVAIMPGLQRGWPEGSFYGFNEIYGAERLAYRGPEFGWWDITDQFAIARMDELFIAPPQHSPVFVFMPSISSHTPFLPTPPYQPDWKRVLTPQPYDEIVVERAWSERPDWTDLGPGYVKAMQYVYTTLSGYLRLRSDRDLVMIIVGDHQPPAAVTGEGATWNVPIHIITSRDAVLDRLIERGFQEGLTPQRPVTASMAGLMPLLLNAFGNNP
jgi:hypothetical protein